MALQLDFVEILRIVIISDRVHFVGKVFLSWYDEHFRGFELESTEVDIFVEQKNLCIHCRTIKLDKGIWLCSNATSVWNSRYSYLVE